MATRSLITHHFFVLAFQGTIEARDYYVPTPSCKNFNKYEWIGQLMGAALRGKDFLVSQAPPVGNMAIKTEAAGPETLFCLVLSLCRSWLCLGWCGSS